MTLFTLGYIGLCLFSGVVNTNSLFSVLFIILLLKMWLCLSFFFTNFFNIKNSNKGVTKTPIQTCYPQAFYQQCKWCTSLCRNQESALIFFFFFAWQSSAFTLKIFWCVWFLLTANDPSSSQFEALNKFSSNL